VEAFLQERGFAKACHLRLQNQADLVVINQANLDSKVFDGDAIMTNFRAGELKPKTMAFSMVVGDCFPLIFFDQKRYITDAGKPIREDIGKYQLVPIRIPLSELRLEKTQFQPSWWMSTSLICTKSLSKLESQFS
jgi:hypothetical protein